VTNAESLNRRARRKRLYNCLWLRHSKLILT
jgi:hypothetical protein